MEKVKLRRFPNRGRCTDCSARRYYIDSGRRYCENGHQDEGYIQYDVDAEDNFGTSGKVVRREKETRTRQPKQLSGDEAKKVFLLCLQCLLRHQVRWLIQAKGFHRDLEQVCKDLWDLRLRGYKFLRLPPTNDDLGKGNGKQPKASMTSSQQQSSPSKRQSQSSLDSDMTGLSMCRSQDEEPTDIDSEIDGHGKSSSSTKDWYGEGAALPSVMDTLALIYLACMLKRERVRIGDIFRWAKGDQMPFLAAIDLIPKEPRGRLPAWAHRALRTRYLKFEGSELHKAVLSLMMGYRDSCGLSFPKLNVPPLMLVWIKDLALPPEVYSYARHFESVLNLEFKLPAEANSKKPGLPDLPDVQLIALIVFATKFAAPLDNYERIPLDDDDCLCFKLDWTAWEAAFTKREKKMSWVDFENLTSYDAWRWKKDQLREYMNWFQETQIDKSTTTETVIDRLFPLEEITPFEVVEDMSIEEIEARYKKVHSKTTYIPPRPDPEDGKGPLRLGDLHELFESPEDLWGVAQRFYEVVAETAGLSLDDLIKAVDKLEKRIWKAEKQGRKELKEGGGQHKK